MASSRDRKPNDLITMAHLSVNLNNFFTHPKESVQKNCSIIRRCCMVCSLALFHKIKCETTSSSGHDDK